jgi:DNA-binding NarL/FixJ family response regulator
MHREQDSTLSNNHCVKTMQARIQMRDIFYFDAQALTRDCVARELARRLPDFNVLEHAFVKDLVASDSARIHTAAAAILYVRGERPDEHRDGNMELDSVSGDLETLEQIAPDLPRVLLSEVEEPEYMLEAFCRHVRGYVPTTLPIDQVAEAIRFVAAGGTFVPQSILSLHTLPSPEARVVAATPELNAVTTLFSPRQIQVLRMLWKGFSNKLIAYELRMCESTVKVHIRHIMKKLNVSNRTQVVLKTRPYTSDESHVISFANPGGGEMRSTERGQANESLPRHSECMLIRRLEGAGV